MLHAQTTSFPFITSPMISGEEYILLSSALRNFPQSPLTSSLFGPNIPLRTLFSLKVRARQPRKLGRFSGNTSDRANEIMTHAQALSFSLFATVRVREQRPRRGHLQRIMYEVAHRQRSLCESFVTQSCQPSTSVIRVCLQGILWLPWQPGSTCFSCPRVSHYKLNTVLQGKRGSGSSKTYRSTCSTVSHHQRKLD